MNPKTIAEKLFFNTVRIDTTSENGLEKSSGTGFLLSYKDGGYEHPFLVTNKHVVMGMREGSITFLVQRNGLPILGEGFRVEITDWEQVWFGHPDKNVDIAICPFLPLALHIKNHHGIDVFCARISSEDIPTSQQLEELDALEPVTFVGYPNGLWDKKNFLPIARRGTTASPISVDFEGEPCFLIDASVFGGSSGSPVFILSQGGWEMKEGGVAFGSRFYFVGVIAKVFFRTQMNQIIPVPVPAQTQFLPMAEQKEMIDIGVVFKAHTVVETIEAYIANYRVQECSNAT